VREWLAVVADELIPAGAGMPSAGEVDVAGRQLDLVLAARPDLLAGLEEAHRLAGALRPPEVLGALPEDGAAREALLLVVAGGYYSSPVVTRLLGYTGQTPEPVRADTYPAYVEEGLLDRVIARGPLYRPTVASQERSPARSPERGSPRQRERER
jgi:hypothetical protein